jgi:hypothetical protein
MMLPNRRRQDGRSLQFLHQALRHFLGAIFLIEGGADLHGTIDQINRRRMPQIERSIALV